VLTCNAKSDIMRHAIVFHQPPGGCMGRPPRIAEFFRVWTPEMAYVLGLWWTDGCMRIKRNTGAHEIEIASNDRGHLEIIARVIGGNFHLRKVAPTLFATKSSFVAKRCIRILRRLAVRHASREPSAFQIYRRNCCRISYALSLMETERYRGTAIGLSSRYTPAHRNF